MADDNEPKTGVPMVLPVYICGILTIATLGAISLLCGLDGQVLAGVVGAIVGLTAGFGAYWYGKNKATKETTAAISLADFTATQAQLEILAKAQAKIEDQAALIAAAKGMASHASHQEILSQVQDRNLAAAAEIINATKAAKTTNDKAAAAVRKSS